MPPRPTMEMTSYGPIFTSRFWILGASRARIESRSLLGGPLRSSPERDPEADEAVAERRRLPAALRRATVARGEPPGSATGDPASAILRSLCVAVHVALVGPLVEQVLAPLPDVPRHVERAIGGRSPRIASDGRRVGPAVVRVH